MTTDNQQITRARDAFIEAVTDTVVRCLLKNGIVLTDRGENQLSDIIRFETTP